jgi:hypothetical protein
MNTTNVILIGVVGVGAVGAYMYMKNKQAQNALLSGSLPASTTSKGGGFLTAPATNQGGGLLTPPATNQGGGFVDQPTTSAGTAVLSTTSDGVSPSDANLNLANATVLVSQRAVLVAKIKAPLPSSTISVGGFIGGVKTNPAYVSALASRESAKKQLVELDKKLATLGYKVDATGALVKI